MRKIHSFTVMATAIVIGAAPAVAQTNGGVASGPMSPPASINAMPNSAAPPSNMPNGAMPEGAMSSDAASNGSASTGDTSAPTTGEKTHHKKASPKMSTAPDTPRQN